MLRLGATPGAHVSALPDRVASSLGIFQGKVVRGFRLLPTVRSFAPAEPRPFDAGFSYFERVPAAQRRPMQKQTVEFDAAPHEIVAVYRHKPYDTAWTGYSVTQDGNAAAPAHTTFNSWLYPAGERGGHWRVEFETDTPQWVEVIAIPR